MLAKWPVAGDYELHPLARLDQLEHALLRREASRVEHLRWARFRANVFGKLDAARNHAHLGSTELTGAVRERIRRRDYEPGAAQNAAREPRHTPRELDVRAPDLDDVRRAGPSGDPSGGNPVGMQQVGVHAARGAHEAREQRGDEQRKPWTAP